MRRDLISAYAASFARVASWAVVTGVVYRVDGAGGLALIAVARSTVGLLSYVGLGISPALVILLAKHVRQADGRFDLLEDLRGSSDDRPLFVPATDRAALEAVSPSIPSPSTGDMESKIEALDYAPPERLLQKQLILDGELLWGGRALAGGLLALMVIAGMVYLGVAVRGQRPLVFETAPVFFLFLVGLAARLYGDVAGAALQTVGRIATDNWLLACTELIWVAVTVAMLPSQGFAAVTVAASFAISGAIFCWLRYGQAAYLFGDAGNDLKWRLVQAKKAAKVILPVGAVVTFGTLADFFYAPMNLLMLDHFTTQQVVAAYAPVLQIDAGLLVLVGGLSAVLLPKAAGAMARGDARTLRAYYVRGTLVSLALLVAAAGCLWAVAPWLLRAWLGETNPLTLAVLPWVMIHTLIGGASGVGRSVLLGMGKAKPLAAGAVIAGLGNVGLAWALVAYAGLGVWGVVYATIFTVTLRCAVWMPWYVLKQTKESLVIGPLSLVKTPDA